MLKTIATFLAESDFRQTVIDLLMNVPGLPPIVQTFHILGIAVVVAALVVPLMKILGIAASGQAYEEMLQRLRPWALGGLGVLLISGAVFVIARPHRYLFNPIVGIKFACLLAALTLTLLIQRPAVNSAPAFTGLQKIAASLALVCWLGVMLAGRWIAYVDYLFWEE